MLFGGRRWVARCMLFGGRWLGRCACHLAGVVGSLCFGCSGSGESPSQPQFHRATKRTGDRPEPYLSVAALRYPRRAGYVHSARMPSVQASTKIRLAAKGPPIARDLITSIAGDIGWYLTNG